VSDGASHAKDLHFGGEGDGDPVGLAQRPLKLIHLGLGIVRQDWVWAQAKSHAAVSTALGEVLKELELVV
jgi:hypothetical protein